MGEIEREAETADAAAIRAEEALLAQQGRVKLGTAALAPDGDVVAYTDLVVTVHESGARLPVGHAGPPRSPRPPARARGEGRQRAPPPGDAAADHHRGTFNADVNAPMVAVNERLGFVPVQWMGEFQKKLG